MTVPELLAEYRRRIDDLHEGYQSAGLRVARAGICMAIAGSGILWAGVLAIRHEASYVWLLPAVVAATATAVWFRRAREAQLRLGRLRRYYDRGVLRLEGHWAGGDSGDEFAPADHRYARDLNVVGYASLFDLLSTARTAIGRRGLADYLLAGASVEEAVLRQQAIRELCPLSALRESMTLLGGFEFFESNWETFQEWLDAPPVEFSRAIQVSLWISSVSMVVLAILGLFPWIAPLVMFHVVVSALYGTQVQKLLAMLGPVSTDVPVLREGLRVLEQQRFTSEKLIQIAARGQGGAKKLRRLQLLLNILADRGKDWFLVPSLLFLAGTQLSMAVERWRLQHGSELRQWMLAWSEFEALNALANYAHENPQNVFPEFSDKPQAQFHAEGMGHPLLTMESCVRNDVDLDGTCRFYVISGSNMSGKSTFMRAIGLNTVLAFAGAPVPSGALRLSRLSLCASLSVVDSLLRGKSKFLAEVDRLRLMIEASLAGEPVLFLIDEIFSGTNSRDRRVAAEAVVRTLVERGAIGALSTHDLALSEIADGDLGGANVHTGSRNGTDPMDFDYRLKPGITTETNALAIARMAGVPV